MKARSHNVEFKFVRRPFVNDSGALIRMQVSRTPVTVEQFEQFINAGGYQDHAYWSPRGVAWLDKYRFTCPTYWMEPGYEAPDLPVTGVCFYEAEAVANFFSAEIPNEREWQFIASNGSNSRYPWGEDTNDIHLKRANLSFFGQFGTCERTPVAHFPQGASEDGILDLIGNVAEWCVSGSADEIQNGALTASMRGGCTWHSPDVVDSSFRDEVSLETRDNQTGIRLIRRHRTAKSTQSTRSSSPSSSASINRPRRRLPRPSAPFRQEGIPEQLTESNWRLNLSGLVERPKSFSLSEIEDRFNVTERRGMFVCVCRWGQVNSVSGTLLSDVIDDAGLTMPVDQLHLVQRSIAGPSGKAYETSVPLKDAFEHEAILCTHLDGKRLSTDLGWPMRLIHFGRLGYKQVKCLGELVVSSTPMVGWWEEACQYDPSGTIQPGTITLVGAEPKKFDITVPGRVPLDQ